MEMKEISLIKKKNKKEINGKVPLVNYIKIFFEFLSKKILDISFITHFDLMMSVVFVTCQK